MKVLGAGMHIHASCSVKTRLSPIVRVRRNMDHLLLFRKLSKRAQADQIGPRKKKAIFLRQDFPWRVVFLCRRCEKTWEKREKKIGKRHHLFRNQSISCELTETCPCAILTQELWNMHERFGSNPRESCRYSQYCTIHVMFWKFTGIAGNKIITMEETK